MRKLLTALTSAFLVFTMPAFASGSAGSYPSSGSSYQRNVDPLQQAYDRGRRQLRKKITCKKCAYPGGVEDRATAIEVLEKVRAGEIEMSEKKRAYLTVYLDRRFSLGLIE